MSDSKGHIRTYSMARVSKYNVIFIVFAVTTQLQMAIYFHMICSDNRQYMGQNGRVILVSPAINPTYKYLPCHCFDSLSQPNINHYTQAVSCDNKLAFADACIMA